MHIHLYAAYIKQSRAYEILNAIPSYSLADIAKLDVGVGIDT